MGFELDKFNEILSELKADFDVIAMAKSAYVLEHLNVKTHDHPTVQWAQALEEMRRRYYGIKRALIQVEILRRDINALDATTEGLEAELKRVDLEELEWSIGGKWQEFLALFNVYQTFPRFTREELEAGQPEYWQRTLARQAGQDLQAYGRVSPANLEGLKQVGLGLNVYESGKVEFVPVRNGNGKLPEGS